jgi:hypothetical protein
LTDWTDFSEEAGRGGEVVRDAVGVDDPGTGRLPEPRAEGPGDAEARDETSGDAESGEAEREVPGEASAFFPDGAVVAPAGATGPPRRKGFAVSVRVLLAELFCDDSSERFACTEITATTAMVTATASPPASQSRRVPGSLPSSSAPTASQGAGDTGTRSVDTG